MDSNKAKPPYLASENATRNTAAIVPFAAPSPALREYNVEYAVKVP